MFPISVNSAADAVNLGVNSYRHQENQLANSLGGLGQALEKGILTARIAKEDSDELKARRLEEALAGGDIEALRKLTGFREASDIPDRISPLPEIEDSMDFIPASVGGREMTAMPSQLVLGGDPDFGRDAASPDLLLKAQDMLKSLRGGSTAHRAAERAGMRTGYLPMSEQDKLAFAEQQAAIEAKRQAEIEAMQRRQKLADDLGSEDLSILNLLNKSKLTNEEQGQLYNSVMQKLGYEPEKQIGFLQGVIPDENLERFRNELAGSLQNTNSQLANAIRNLNPLQLMQVLPSVIAGASGDENIKQQYMLKVLGMGKKYADQSLVKDYMLTQYPQETLDAVGFAGKQPPQANPAQAEPQSITQEQAFGYIKNNHEQFTDQQLLALRQAGLL